MDSNCPNCGAPIAGAKCEYCGTVFHSEEYKDLLAKKAVELQAAQIRMNANLIQSIQPYYYQNSFYPLETGMQTLQASRDELQRMQDRNLIDSINLGLQAAARRDGKT